MAPACALATRNKNECTEGSPRDRAARHIARRVIGTAHRVVGTGTCPGTTKQTKECTEGSPCDRAAHHIVRVMGSKQYVQKRTLRLSTYFIVIVFELRLVDSAFALHGYATQTPCLPPEAGSGTNKVCTTRNPARKTDFRPGGTIDKHRAVSRCMPRDPPVPKLIQV